MGVASLVLGILGLFIALIPLFGYTALLGLVLGLVGLILGIIGRRQAMEQGEKTGTATAGIVLGIIAIVLGGAIFAACQYCQHKVGKALEKGVKNAKSFGMDLLSTSVCTELTPAGDRCKDPRGGFPLTAPQVHVVFRTSSSCDRGKVSFYRVGKSGSFSSRTLTHASEAAVFKAKDGKNVVVGTWKRPTPAWSEGIYSVKVRCGARSVSRGFRIGVRGPRLP